MSATQYTKDNMLDMREYARRLELIKCSELLSDSELERTLGLSTTSLARLRNQKPEYKFNALTQRKLRDYVDAHYKESMEGK